MSSAEYLSLLQSSFTPYGELFVALVFWIAGVGILRFILSVFRRGAEA